MADLKPKADTEQMENLHGQLLETLLNNVDGTTVLTKEGEEVVIVDSKILNVARQFLKDNNITSDISKSDGLQELEAKLPYEAEPEHFEQSPVNRVALGGRKK